MDNTTILIDPLYFYGNHCAIKSQNCARTSQVRLTQFSLVIRTADLVNLLRNVTTQSVEHSVEHFDIFKHHPTILHKSDYIFLVNPWMRKRGGCRKL